MGNKIYVKSFNIDKIKELLKYVDSVPDIYSMIKDKITDYYGGIKKIVDVTVKGVRDVPLLVFHFDNGDNIGFCFIGEELAIRLNESIAYNVKNGLFNIEALRAEQEKLLNTLFEEERFSFRSVIIDSIESKSSKDQMFINKNVFIKNEDQYHILRVEKNDLHRIDVNYSTNIVLKIDHNEITVFIDKDDPKKELYVFRAIFKSGDNMRIEKSVVMKLVDGIDFTEKFIINGIACAKLMEE